MSKYEFHYFNWENVTDIPDQITPRTFYSDYDAFFSLDMEQEYLHGSRSPLSVMLVKDGKNMADEFLAWLTLDD
jgi:hypothetical protein